jgi:excisionase family DNA binding protein
MSNYLSMEIKNPNKHDRGIAQQSFQQIKSINPNFKKAATLDLGTEHVELPKSAVKLLITILREMAEGNSLTLIPGHAYLTTQEGADMLSVSRPFFVKLLEEGKIPFEKVGNRRRVKARDVLEFKQRAQENREKLLQQLSDQAQSLDMGY